MINIYSNEMKYILEYSIEVLSIVWFDGVIECFFFVVGRAVDG
jgi:hypothetical protein